MSASVVARAVDHAAWQWPLDLAGYDRRPALTRREMAALNRRARFPRRLGHWTPLFHDELGRLTRPVTDALEHLDIRTDRVRATVQRLLTHEMHRPDRRPSLQATARPRRSAPMASSTHRGDVEGLSGVSGPRRRPESRRTSPARIVSLPRSQAESC